MVLTSFENPHQLWNCTIVHRRAVPSLLKIWPIKLCLWCVFMLV